MKKKWIVGVGAGTALLAVYAAVKSKFSHDKDINSSIEEDDRGVAPVSDKSTKQSSKDEVPDLKADAINHPYKQNKY